MKLNPPFEHETGLSKSGRANRLFSCLFSFHVNTDNVWVHFKAWNWAVLSTLEELVTSIFRPSKESSAVILKAEGKWRLHLQGRS